ncbi:hypothetical protein [Heyndrickxia ginsengihumi]|uniref:hypothetical protein n=1 Tax=Heyndrickxia ginsengihumi TaxID=363870 RepID=UPI0004703922|nr:hypothetical protein [Heyndrickxia ginsengihumi]
METITDKEMLQSLEKKYDKLNLEKDHRNEQLGILSKQLELVENDPTYISPEIEVLETQLRETGKAPEGTILFVETKKGKALAGKVKRCTDDEMTISFTSEYSDVVFKTNEIPNREIHIWMDQNVDIEFIQSIFDDLPENMEVEI